MNLIEGISDFHTHNLQATHALINLPDEWLLRPEEAQLRPEAHYTAGIHPWATNKPEVVEAMMAMLPQWLHHPQVVALGECGLDTLRGAPIPTQVEIFVQQIRLAEELQLPVTLHIVHAFNQLLQLKKELRPTTQWTVHGFRGKPALAQQLLRTGLDLSFGSRYNLESWSLTPPERRHRETDNDFII